MTETLTATAYPKSVVVDFDGEALTIRATGKAARLAMFGPNPREQVTLRLDEIERVSHYHPPALLGWIANGRLDVHAVGGDRFQVHYRVRKNRDMRALAERVVAAVGR